MHQLIFIELNEINFDDVRRYGVLGELPVLTSLVERHGVTETVSEVEYDHLEPWIQWITAHTGQTFAEHGVFRLGDIVDRDIPQIWETLEAQGLRVAAVSPMNANNRCQDPAFFIPDPWTQTPVSAPPVARALYSAICQAVNDNASSRLTRKSALALVAGLALYARPANYFKYASLLEGAATGKSWSKALLLDLLLTDLFVRLTASKKPNFATLFLNAGAHIQHHYMFNSKVYEGVNRNPEWYAPESADPVLDVYRLYDRAVGQIMRAFPGARFMLCTGLHQDPHNEVTFYWRLKDHARFLGEIGVVFERVEPRMSRDFVVFHKGPEEAQSAKRRLENVRAQDGTSLFEVDNRGDSLFVTLTWPHDVPDEFMYLADNRFFSDLREKVAFVAIKNGSHNGTGYILDTGVPAVAAVRKISLSEVPGKVASALGARWSPVPVSEAVLNEAPARPTGRRRR
jgi:hypothetical protein